MMPAYHSKIKIKKKPQMLKAHVEVNLGQETILTLKRLRELGVTEKDKFQIYEHDGQGIFYLEIYRTRLETPEEVTKRVEKEKQYMKNYKAFHVRMQQQKERGKQDGDI